MKRVLLGLAILTSIKSYASIDIKELVESKERALKQKICHDIDGISTDDAFYSKDAGLAYPILSGIPLLRSEHAVIASLYELIN